MNPIQALRMRAAAAPPATDPNFSSVVLLCGYNGTNGSTTLVDESSTGRTLTAGGNAQLDTSQSKFGASSLLLDGAGDYCQAADSADWAFGSGQFTIEAFLRKSTAGAEYTIASQWSSTAQATNAAWAFFGTTGNLAFYFFDSAGTLRTANAAVTNTANIWRHYAVDRDSAGKVRIYVDGTMLIGTTLGQTMIDSPQAMRVGATNGSSLDTPGWMDEVRITKGVARYANDSGFTVPAAAFPRS